LNTQGLTSKPLPVGFPTDLAYLPYGKCKIKCLVSGWNIKKIVKQLFLKFTLNRRGREKRDVPILRHDDKQLRDFHSEDLWICQPQCIYSEAKISSVCIKWFLSNDTKRTCPVSLFLV